MHLGDRQQGRRSRSASHANAADDRSGKQAHGLPRFTAFLGAFQSLPGVGIVNNPMVTRAFSEAQVVANLGDRAGWKNGSLAVLKNQLLFHIGVSGQPSEATGLKVATSVAQSVLEHLQTP